MSVGRGKFYHPQTGEYIGPTPTMGMLVWYDNFRSEKEGDCEDCKKHNQFVYLTRSASRVCCDCAEQAIVKMGYKVKL